MQRTRYLASVVGTLLALGASFGGVAAAEPVDGNARSIAVQYGDLELGNGLAIERLYARLARGRRARLRGLRRSKSPRAQRLASLLRGCVGRRGRPRTARSLGRAASIGARTSRVAAGGGSVALLIRFWGTVVRTRNGAVPGSPIGPRC